LKAHTNITATWFYGNGWSPLPPPPPPPPLLLLLLLMMMMMIMMMMTRLDHLIGLAKLSVKAVKAAPTQPLDGSLARLLPHPEFVPISPARRLATTPSRAAVVAPAKRLCDIEKCKVPSR
jgi:hypothetical protein